MTRVEQMELPILKFSADDSAELYANWETLKNFTNELILGLLIALYPDRKIYSLSMDWRNDRKFILKARGVYGDIIVKWL